jgi:hypothetical protein
MVPCLAIGQIRGLPFAGGNPQFVEESNLVETGWLTLVNILTLP